MSLIKQWLEKFNKPVVREIIIRPFDTIELEKEYRINEQERTKQYEKLTDFLKKDEDK